MLAYIKPAKIQGTITIPGSKSHTIRALLFATLSSGESLIENYLQSHDTQACIEVIKKFGAEVKEIPATTNRHNLIRIKGNMSEKHHIINKACEDIIDVRNSGTTLFLSMSIASLSPGYNIFTGDNQIRSRSAEPLLNALQTLGAEVISTKENGCAPFVIRGIINGGTVHLSCPVSQYLSSLMLACPLIKKGSITNIHIPFLNEIPYAEMTAEWLRKLGIEFENDNWKYLRIPGGQHYHPFKQTIPGDFSAATFFAVATALSGGSLLLNGLDMADSQGDKEIFSILTKMGCTIKQHKEGIYLTAPATLQGGDFDLNNIPDTLPAIAIAAAFAQGETRLLNVPQARLKETDRIHCMAEELTKLGIQTTELADGLIIQGTASVSWPNAQLYKSDSTHNVMNGTIVLDGHGDHRIVMACTLAGLVSPHPVTVLGAEVASVTLPGFFDMLNSCSISIDGTPCVQLIADEKDK